MFVVEAMCDVSQDSGNNSEDKREYWGFAVREDGQGPGSSCRQRARSREESRVIGMIGSHTAI